VGKFREGGKKEPWPPTEPLEGENSNRVGGLPTGECPEGGAKEKKGDYVEHIIPSKRNPG